MPPSYVDTSPTHYAGGTLKDYSNVATASSSHRRHTRATTASPTSSSSPSKGKKNTSDEAPASKGTWMPAAIFIFISHVLVGLYFVGFVHAKLFADTSSFSSSYTWIYAPSLRLLFLTWFGAWLNLLGITAGYHRLWSHGAYRATFPLKVFLAIIGLCSFQGSARWWVLKHRLHHRFTDTSQDPYDSNKGLFYSHIGWLFEQPPYFEKIKLIRMKDLDEDLVVVWQKKYLLHGYVIFGLILPGLIGLVTDGSFLLGAFWIGFIGRFISWHCIWTINSLSHWHGIREYSRRSSAVYVALLNLVQNGEGHHNYHHAHEKDFRHGHRWYEWDPTKWCILLWSYLGLAYDLHTTPPNLIAQSLSQVADHHAHELHAQAEWPKEDVPEWTELEWKEMASKQKEKKIMFRIHNSIIDVTTFLDHPGGISYLRAYHGKDATAAFEGEINLHTQAATNLAMMYRVARVKGE